MAFATIFLCLILVPSALAAPPFHSRAKALDVTGLNKACGVATDTKGDLYASSAGTDEIKVYGPAPTHTLLATISNANEPCGLAVTTTGALYVSEQATGVVVRYKPDAYPLTGTPLYGPREVINASGDAEGIAVDPVGDRLYVAEGDHVAVYKADGTFEEDVLTGKLTEATGVSAYTHTSTAVTSLRRTYLSVADAAGDAVKVFSGGTTLTTLKLRRTIAGVDANEDGEVAEAEQFGFGASGAYLAADPGNESSARKCDQVEVPPKGPQACTAGHFFLFDAQHGAVNEFDATGEFLLQFSAAGLEDAGPTQVTVDRSAVAGDGTVYVSSGSSAGAELLAFEPLLMPSREALGTPLSRVLAGALGVAVDCRGNVYVAAQTAVYVFGPAGQEITSFETPAQLRDVAANCAGNVYVVEEGTKESSAPLTYYTPSKYPPDGSTTYTRHEPPLLPDEEGIGVGSETLTAVAVNPANGHVFALGSGVVSFPQTIVEFGSIAEGSPYKGECGKSLLGSSGRVDIGVYGATGEVYVGRNGRNIYALRCGTESEVVRQFNGGGCPSGEIGQNPALAVDQSNGHVVEYANNQAGGAAREYDSAGACLAEFGAFSPGSAEYKVAIDNSCALHEPPLTEQTTPKCKEEFPSDGTAYVAWDTAENEVQPYDVNAFGPLEYPDLGDPPTAVTLPADGFEPGGATLRGTVNPNGAPLEACTFEYLPRAEYEESGESFAGAETEECVEDPEGTKPVPVHAEVDGLAAGTAYCFRLLASSANGAGAGEAECFGPPLASAGQALPVAYDEATLRGEVDPSSVPTEYHFEYLTQAEYVENGGTFAGALLTPAKALSAGEEPVAVAASLTGLAEGTVYRFRVVAENPIGGAEDEGLPFETLERAPAQACENAEYRTGFSNFLPDCRAYELVSPPRTNQPPNAPSHGSGGTFFNSYLVAPRGPGAGESVGFLAGVDGADIFNFRAQRGAGDHPAGGWGTEPYGLTFAQAALAFDYAGVSADQRYWLFRILQGETPTPLLFPQGAYMRVPSGGAEPQCTPDPQEKFALSDPAGQFEAVGCGSLGVDLDVVGRFVSAGGAHVIFTAQAGNEEQVISLGENTTGGTFTLSFEGSGPSEALPYDAGAQAVEEGLEGLSTIDPGDVAVSSQAAGGPYTVEFTGSLSLQDVGLLGAEASGLTTSEGSPSVDVRTTRVVKLEPTAGDGVSIYDREAGSASAEVVSTRPDGAPFGAGEAPSYVTATEDGEAVVFEVAGALYVHREGKTTQVAASPNTFAGISGDGERVFYIDTTFFGIQVPAAGLYACDVEAAPCAGPGAQAPISIASDAIFVNVAADGSSAYFTSEADLAAGAEAGQPNLYLWDEGTVSFVAVLDPQDLVGFRFFAGIEGVEFRVHLGRWTSAIQEDGRSRSPTRSTADGGVLVFQSHAQLTSYDNQDKGEIYRYEADAPPGQELLCVSCDPSGAPPLASTFTAFLQLVGKNQDGVTKEDTVVPNVTDDGRAVFFQSPRQLLPEDTNQAADVYEWRAQGSTGPGGDTCQRQAGCLALVSTGQNEESSVLFGMSADGHDVFFVTREQLAGGDVGGTPSLYDARVLGGIPESPSPAPCQGDACQGQGTAPPSLAVPATTGTGEGTAPAAGKKPCAKGKKRVKGRCVKPKRHPKQHRHGRRAGHEGRAHR